MASYSPFNELRLETVQSSTAAAAKQDRPYLLLEDLLDDPFEWTLCDVNAPASATAGRAGAAVNIH
jgi:hypothetical protein